MESRDTPISNLGFYALLYLPLVAVAFYLTYFSVIDEQPILTHLHFVVMASWLALSIVQPLLIRAGKWELHRKVGRLSYVVLPMVVVTGYAMLRNGAVRELNNLRGQVTSGAETLSEPEILAQVYDYALLGTPYIFWPAIFYTLAMVHRRTMVFHSRYMLAAILTMTGPIVDRIFFLSLGLMHIGPLPAETISFLLIDGILVAMLLYDRRKGRSIKPLTVSLIIYLVGQLGYFLIQKTAAWYFLAEHILQIG
jgi:hypothetical protein